MGAALAAHLTNLGFSVTVLDTSAPTALQALDRIRSSFHIPEKMGEIRVMSYEDGITTLGDADWIVEAITERLLTKRNLYARIAPYVRADAVVTTCSSSIPVSDLTHDLPEAFTTRFLALCFALPLDKNRLVEVRPGPDSGLAEDFSKFLLSEVSRKPILVPNGQAGPYARYGLWCLLLGAQVAEKLRLDVEDVEAIASLVMSEGLFGVIDRVGIDLLNDVLQNLNKRYPEDRGLRALSAPNSFTGLLARGWIGDKVGRGYLRREGKDQLALDRTTMAYRQARAPSIPSLLTSESETVEERLRSALSGRDEVGEFLREFLLTALRYAEYLRESADFSVPEMDRTMEWGFGWREGPFKLLDALSVGAERYYLGGEYLTRTGYASVPSTQTFLGLQECPVIDRSDAYTVRDLGDGIQAVGLMGSVLTPERAASIEELLHRSTLQRFVLTSEKRDFPTLDIRFILGSATDDKAGLNRYLSTLQSISKLLSERICVAAISGHCVGPTMGFALSCTNIVTLDDANLGFDEGRLGLVPTAGGVALMRALYVETPKRMGEITVALAQGFVADNAPLASNTGYLRPEDRIEHLPERLLLTAKNLVQGGQKTAQRAFARAEPVLVGIIDRGLVERRQRGQLTEYDAAIGQRIRQILARTANDEECLDRERNESIELAGKALTQARLRHALDVGKPLRN